MNKRFHIAIFALAAAVAMAVAGATFPAPHVAAQSGLDPLAALPASDIVLMIDAGRLINQIAPQALANDPATLKKMNDGINEINASTGIDMRAVKRVVVGMPMFDVKAIAASGQFPGVAIVEGIDTAKVLALIATSGAVKSSETTHGGKTIYTLAPKDETKTNGATTSPRMPLQKMSLVALDANTLAVGDVTQVRASIDASAGRGMKTSGDLLMMASRNPNALVSVAGNFPSEQMRQLLDGAGPLPISDEAKQAIMSITQLYSAVGSSANGYDFLLGVRTGGAAQAKTLSDTLAAFKALGLMGTTDAKDKVMRDFISGIQITPTGNDLELKAEITQMLINELMKPKAPTPAPSQAAAEPAPPASPVSSASSAPPARPRLARRAVRRRARP